ncbi:glycosyltransferase [Candidatus Poribacteria bacterium]|nr:glycosyltransferase [Candidatus Poribacteria bacterium]
MNILYTVTHGHFTGGNVVCLRVIEEALKRKWKVFINSPSNGEFINYLKEKYVNVYYINTTRSFRIDKCLQISRVLKKNDIKIIHTHAPLPDTNISRIAGAISGVPVISHLHTCGPILNSNILIRKYQLLLEKFSSKYFCHKSIAVSKAVKNAFLNTGYPDSKIEIIYNGINTKTFLPVKKCRDIFSELGIKSDYKLIGQVSYLCKSKGQHILIKAMGSVIRKNPNVVLMFVGEDLQQGGRYRRELEKMAKNMGILGNVIFTGYRSDIPDIMNSLDFFILPSYGEAFPITILEAMAAKKPVITTPVGGNTELVIDKETGIIVPVGDYNKLSEAILYLLENPEKVAFMGQNGYERVKKHFSLDNMVQKVFQIYEEVL